MLNSFTPTRSFRQCCHYIRKKKVYPEKKVYPKKKSVFFCLTDLKFCWNLNQDDFKTQLLNGQEGTLQTDMHITKQAGKWNQIFMRQIWLKQMVVFLCFSYHAAFEIIFFMNDKRYLYYKIMIWDLRMWLFFIYIPTFI